MQMVARRCAGRHDAGMNPKRLAAVASLPLLLTACGGLRYDLDAVCFPLHADSATYQGAGEPFEIDSKYVLYVHGLLGDKQPPVAALLNEELAGAKAVTDLRVSAGANLWDWLGTHLSLGFVRLKTVTISGRVVR